MRFVMHDCDLESCQYLEEQIHILHKNTGQPITVDLTAGDIRGYTQNNLYQDATRYLAKFIAAQDGIEYTEDVHDWIKQRVQRKWGLTREYINTASGRREVSLVSTTKYTKTEMCSLITCVLAYCGEIGVNVPIKGQYLEILEAQSA